jgi:hypothetical protein
MTGIDKTVSAGAYVAAALAMVMVATAACAKPANVNLSLDRTSDQGIFRIEIVSQINPIPISKVHQWSVNLRAQNGAPVAGASLKVDGGMPEHRHGLPTAPRAEAASSPGRYVIKGMKFSMRGWWVLNLYVRTPEGLTDKITFNVVL